jgi:hypothetical protein
VTRFYTLCHHVASRASPVTGFIQLDDDGSSSQRLARNDDDCRTSAQAGGIDRS